MDDQEAMGQDPQSEPTEAPESAPGVHIAPNGDGTFTVSLMGDDDSDPSDTADQPQSAPDIDSALQMAKTMLTGEASEEEAEPEEGDGDAPLAQGDAKKYWNQMASSRAKQKAMG